MNRVRWIALLLLIILSPLTHVVQWLPEVPGKCDSLQACPASQSSLPPLEEVPVEPDGSDDSIVEYALFPGRLSHWNYFSKGQPVEGGRATPPEPHLDSWIRPPESWPAASPVRV